MRRSEPHWRWQLVGASGGNILGGAERFRRRKDKTHFKEFFTDSVRAPRFLSFFLYRVDKTRQQERESTTTNLNRLTTRQIACIALKISLLALSVSTTTRHYSPAQQHIAKISCPNLLLSDRQEQIGAAGRGGSRGWLLPAGGSKEMARKLYPLTLTGERRPAKRKINCGPVYRTRP